MTTGMMSGPMPPGPSRRSWSCQTPGMDTATWTGVLSSGVLLLQDHVQRPAVPGACRVHAAGTGFPQRVIDEGPLVGRERRVGQQCRDIPGRHRRISASTPPGSSNRERKTAASHLALRGRLRPAMVRVPGPGSRPWRHAAPGCRRNGRACATVRIQARVHRAPPASTGYRMPPRTRPVDHGGG